MAGKRKKMPAFVLAAMGVFLVNSSLVFADAPLVSLDDSVAMALKNNSAIKIALTDRDKALLGIDEAKAGGGPTLSLSSSGNRSMNMAEGTPGNSFSNSLRLSMPLYTGGRLAGQVDQAKLNAHAADLGVIKAQQQTTLAATTAYFTVLQSHNMVKVNQEAVDSLTAHLNNVQAQYSVGTVAKSDVLGTQVQLANAQQNLTKAQNAYDVAVSSLNNITGMPLDTQNTYQDDLSYTPYAMSLDDSITAALKNRPEIGQSKDSVDAAKVGVKVADSGHLPTVSVSGAEGWSDNNFPGTANNNWSVGISASWNLFDSGLTNAKVKEAKAAADKAAEQDKSTHDSIELEVRQDYLSMKEAEQRIQTSSVAVDQAADALKIAEAKYQAGAGTNLDVMDAELDLTQAKTNHTQALYDYNTNKAKLETAIGGVSE
ncbi:MAG: TolC family protein [Veillonellales bacterium]